MNRPLTTWLVFGLFFGLASAALGWLTWQTLELDHAEAVARAQAEQEERIGLALWRMDAFLMPLLVEEASRPEYVYQPSYLAGNLRDAKEPQSKTLSPLLQHPSEYVKLHFQVTAAGRLTSPEAPRKVDVEWLVAQGAIPDKIVAGQNNLADLQGLLSYQDLIARLPVAEFGLPTTGAIELAGKPLSVDNSNPVVESFAQQSLARQQEDQTPIASNNASRRAGYGNNELAQVDNGLQAVGNDATNTLNRRPSAQQRNPNADLSSRNNVYQAYAQRAASEQFNNNTANAPVISQPSVEGVSRPFWVGDELLLARRVERAGESLVQGCWFDWPKISERLRDEIVDVLPEVQFRPANPADSRALGHVLATLPVQVVAPPLADSLPTWSPIRIALALAWLGLLIATVAAAATLHGILTLSERRAAFVAAVTHELRTPLTTFRMYAEMLAGGMVPSERQPTYLETLRIEADRLAHLVENVLQYARLERGGQRVPRETISVGNLHERLLPRLAARTSEAGLTLEMKRPVEIGEEQVVTDVAALEQVLFNLVDNASKYAAHGDDKRLHVELSSEGKTLVWRVRDHGPGIPQPTRRRLFQPFSKSVHEAALTAPGVGLGLALCRRLIQELGGRLSLEKTGPAGTVFALRLPFA